MKDRLRIRRPRKLMLEIGNLVIWLIVTLFEANNISTSEYISASCKNAKGIWSCCFLAYHILWPLITLKHMQNSLHCLINCHKMRKIKFSIKLQKNMTEIFNNLTHVYRDQVLTGCSIILVLCHILSKLSK